jgi:hypothetical protein
MIAFHPKWNDIEVYPSKPKAKKADATEFRRGALLYSKYCGPYESKIVVIDNKDTKQQQAEAVLEALKNFKGHHRIAFFCHGYSNGIQFGIRSNDSILWWKFVESICECARGSVSSQMAGSPNVLLYACSTGTDPDGNPDTAPGSGDNSFADRLRDSICWSGGYYCRVVAHTTTGHAWHNPNVKIFDGNGSPYGGVGSSLLFSNPTMIKTFRGFLQYDQVGKRPKNWMFTSKHVDEFCRAVNLEEFPTVAWKLDDRRSEMTIRKWVSEMVDINNTLRGWWVE